MDNKANNSDKTNTEKDPNTKANTPYTNDSNNNTNPAEKNVFAMEKDSKETETDNTVPAESSQPAEPFPSVFANVNDDDLEEALPEVEIDHESMDYTIRNKEQSPDNTTNVFANDPTNTFDNTAASIDATIAETSAETNAKNKARAKKSRYKKVGLIAGALVIVASIGIGSFLFFRPDDTNAPLGEETETREGYVNIDYENIDEGNFWEEDDRTYPVPVEDWQLAPYDEQRYSDLRKSLLSTFRGTEAATVSGQLPSEEAGYTANPEREFLEDGTRNPRYSYWTYESFFATLQKHVQILLNPKFGKWEAFQYPNGYAASEFTTNVISDIVTTNWINENAAKQYKEYVPLYADWDSDNYGGIDNLLTIGPRWYGEVTESTTDFTFSRENNRYRVSYEAQVRFIAWTNTQGTIEKTGTLTLSLVPNQNKINNPDSNQTVLIDAATLDVK